MAPASDMNVMEGAWAYLAAKLEDWNGGSTTWTFPSFFLAVIAFVAMMGFEKVNQII